MTIILVNYATNLCPRAHALTINGCLTNLVAIHDNNEAVSGKPRCDSMTCLSSLGVTRSLTTVAVTTVCDNVFYRCP